jgi:hypothetical protein
MGKKGGLNICSCAINTQKVNIYIENKLGLVHAKKRGVQKVESIFLPKTHHRYN